MKSILREQRRSSSLVAVITIVLGGLLVCWPDRSVKVLCLLLGAAILITGIVYILGWAARRKQGAPSFFVLPGIILLALGLWLMSSPKEVVLLIQIIFGGVLVFHGVVDLQGAVALMHLRWDRWWLDLMLAALTVGLGALILVNPFGTFTALVILIGLSLVFDGASDLFLIWRLSRAFRQVKDDVIETEGRVEDL